MRVLGTNLATRVRDTRAGIKVANVGSCESAVRDTVVGWMGRESQIWGGGLGTAMGDLRADTKAPNRYVINLQIGITGMYYKIVIQ